jgi:hypothetical protein
MKNKTKQPKGTDAKKIIRMRLNNRTTITLKNDTYIKVWMERYPDAKLI